MHNTLRIDIDLLYNSDDLDMLKIIVLCHLGVNSHTDLEGIGELVTGYNVSNIPA